ncbi:MAG: cytochrome c oxidase assembly protein [Alphaproteobacteria bacterium]|nr:cytochrome c oxidase assembly protein [Alphaproteobacteria bacterium]
MILSRNGRTALSLAMLVAGMVMLTYASVPLYRAFCQLTGFAGTPLKAAANPNSAAVGKEITVTFNADTDAGLPWNFKPNQHEVKVRPGQTMLISYHAENRSDKAVMGTATFNVSPPQASPYFNKIQCFCFEEQTLEAGQKVDMPVSFFIDPAILDDPDVKDIGTITLSYTFFKLKK